jgi:diguanylate cyclase (GGDEF)-like protein
VSDKTLISKSMDPKYPVPSPDALSNTSVLMKIKRERILRQRQTSEDMGYIDPLTRLTNREYFYTKAFTVLKSKFNRYNTHCILLLMDIADFKSINSLFGCSGADECLQETAVRLLEGIEMIKGDVSLSRTGSNEFAMLIGSLGMSNHETVAYANHLIKTIYDKFESPVQMGAQQYQLKIHMGVTLFLAYEKELESMINEASLALNAAKKHPTRMFCFFDQEMAETSALKCELLGAFQNEAEKRVLLYYQPIVDHALRTVGYEVLSRWQKQSGEIISAQDFIVHMEESGQIIAFDKYVFEKVCKQISAWQEEGEVDSVEYISINISPISFMSADFLLYIPKTIEKYGVDPNAILLEITENELLSDFDLVERRMKLLNEYGIRFALDDYGTGYASLSYLHRLPFSELKIDRSLIADIEHDRKNRKIVSLILTMAETIGLKVIAEGVETVAQRDILLSMGCVYFQGYLFDSPSLPMVQRVG